MTQYDSQKISLFVSKLTDSHPWMQLSYEPLIYHSLRLLHPQIFHITYIENSSEGLIFAHYTSKIFECGEFPRVAIGKSFSRKDIFSFFKNQAANNATKKREVEGTTKN